MEDLQCKYADITVNPKEMSFVVTEGWDFVPPYQYLWLNKDGTGRSPHWEIGVDAEWMHVTPWVGDVPSRVRVGCASIGMAAGVYEATITIISHVKIDTPQIPVVLTVRPKPQPPQPPPPPPEPEPEPGPEPEPPPPPPGPEPEPEPPNGKACWVCQIIGKVGRAMRRQG